MNNEFHIETDHVNTLVSLKRCHYLRNIKQLGLFMLFGFALASVNAEEITEPPNKTIQASTKSEESLMWLTIGQRQFAVTLADTEAAREFESMLPLCLDMDDLNRNEKHANLPKALPTETIEPKTIKKGDLMLWGSRTLVVFYKKFDTSYSYT
ncbi:hypothetical protein LCGC14_2402520, partial [marine sediment metagenome]